VVKAELLAKRSSQLDSRRFYSVELGYL